ncbi:hypothetical protein [Rhodococcoides kyotonense]|uniref:Uncharacterized protein n=1 Tax=Rhodococcoides kyotonense TaxID=398843 RepID=A0A239KH47_9NOCA|nr:hypothetical protein [Rhodococcus kyotonensis]SNT17491.1 hypothetical protein SAMN05421642_110174 [Rhodococcus kyotonensis]
MVWSRGMGRSAAYAAVLVVLATGTAACSGSVRASDERCSGGEAPSVRITGDEAPLWADRWVPGAGGSLGGGVVTQAGDDDSTFQRVYSCVGLADGTWTAMSMGSSTTEQRAVRVGIEDYFYRAGDLTVEDRRYAVDVIVAQTDSEEARFGVAFWPLVEPRSLDDIYGGAYVVQRMREAGVF